MANAQKIANLLVAFSMNFCLDLKVFVLVGTGCKKSLKKQINVLEAKYVRRIQQYLVLRIPLIANYCIDGESPDLLGDVLVQPCLAALEP